MRPLWLRLAELAGPSMAFGEPAVSTPHITPIRTLSKRWTHRVSKSGVLAIFRSRPQTPVGSWHLSSGLDLRSGGISSTRKAVETFLKARKGRKLKVTVGDVTVKGTASEVAKLITPEQISKMLDAQKNSPKKSLHD